MNFEPVKVRALKRVLAMMPDDASVYVLVADGGRVPLLSVATLHEANEVELGGAGPSDAIT
jgi:hypothetical protein